MGRGDREYINPSKGSGSHRGGALHLARIHGTEEDRVNCPFYFKIGIYLFKWSSFVLPYLFTNFAISHFLPCYLPFILFLPFKGLADMETDALASITCPHFLRRY